MTNNERRVFAAVGTHLTVAPKIYTALEGLDKATIDATLNSLQPARLVVLFEHSAPCDSDRSRLIHPDGKVFVGACRRVLDTR